MPALATPLTPWTIVVCVGRFECAPAEGLEGRKVGQAAEEALRQLLDCEAAVLGAGEDHDDFQYGPVRPKRVSVMQVRYVFAGKGAPRPVPLEDGP